MTDGSILCTVGVPYPLAAEIGRQITAGVGNPDLLCKVGLNATPAIELARQINAVSFSADLLCRAMWNPTTATALAILGAGGGAPFLSMNFATGTYTAANGSSLILASQLTATRSQTAGSSSTAIDSDGLVHLFAANTPRIVSGNGILLPEPAATNLLVQSADVTNTAWTKFANVTGVVPAPTMTATYGAAPDGTSTAVLVVINRADNTSFSQYNQSFTGTAANHSGGVWMKAATAGDVGKVVDIAFYDGTATLSPVVHYALTNAWVRVPVLGYLLAASASCQLVVGYLPIASGGNSQTGAAGFLTWNHQVELGSVLSSDIVAGASQATRGAETMPVAGALATALATSTGAISALTVGSIQSAAGTIVADNGIVYLGKDATNHLVTAEGAALASSTTGNWVNANTTSLSFSPAGGTINLNGVAVSDAVARTPTGPFILGSIGGASSFFSGYLKRLDVY